MSMNSPEVRVVVAYHSGFGHTARQAEAVVDGAAAVDGVTAVALPVDEPDEELWARLAEADAIVFGSPTYMGGASAAFRGFAEHSAKLMQDGLRWRDKIAAGFTCSGSMSGDKLNTLISMALLAAQHAMIWVGVAGVAGWNHSYSSIEDHNRLGGWLGAMAQADADQPPELVPPDTDLRTARQLGRRVAEVTLRHRLGATAVTATTATTNGPAVGAADGSANGSADSALPALAPHA